MIVNLASALLALPEVSRILVTLNIPEEVVLPVDARLEIILNSTPQGFGANHNRAFYRSNTSYFCPLNPDVQLNENPFPTLLIALDSGLAGLSAPLVIGTDGGIEDSIRHFPTITGLVKKTAGIDDGSYAITAGQADFHPEWVGGMCMLFRRDVYKKLNGFDEGFFLYYEDVDICIRTWQAGFQVIACPSTTIIHNARRDSHRNIRHLLWHLSSMVRYFWKHFGRLPNVSTRSKCI